MHHENGKMVCRKCGHFQEGKISSSEKFTKKEKGKGVVNDINIFADYDFVCEKCGFNKAQVIERGPDYSDEDSVTMFKCGKCSRVTDVTKKRK